ncbi:hypothetical protein OSTOST_01785, partial [Ostertagia ostertagi]
SFAEIAFRTKWHPTASSSLAASQRKFHSERQLPEKSDDASVAATGHAVGLFLFPSGKGRAHLFQSAQASSCYSHTGTYKNQDVADVKPSPHGDNHFVTAPPVQPHTHQKALDVVLQAFPWSHRSLQRVLREFGRDQDGARVISICFRLGTSTTAANPVYDLVSRVQIFENLTPDTTGDRVVNILYANQSFGASEEDYLRALPPPSDDPRSFQDLAEVNGGEAAVVHYAIPSPEIPFMLHHRARGVGAAPSKSHLNNDHRGLVCRCFIQDLRLVWGIPPRSICVITFTGRHTRQIKELLHSFNLDVELMSTVDSVQRTREKGSHFTFAPDGDFSPAVSGVPQAYTDVSTRAVSRWPSWSIRLGMLDSLARSAAGIPSFSARLRCYVRHLKPGGSKMPLFPPAGVTHMLSQ